MKILVAVVCIFAVCQPVVSWACTPDRGQFQNYQAKQSDACYQITDGKHVNLCTEPIRVFFGSDSIYIDPETDPTPFGQPYGPVVYPGETIDGTPDRMGCYPDACQEELTLVVGPADVVIDENYSQNEQLTVYTYTYEVQNEKPVDCNSEEPDAQEKMPTPQPAPVQSNDTSTDDDGGCSSTPSSPAGPIGLIALVLLGLVRRVKSST